MKLINSYYGTSTVGSENPADSLCLEGWDD